MKVRSRISLIAAYTHKNICIGRNNSLPWLVPSREKNEKEKKSLDEFRVADLRRFKRITIGKPVIMGYNTHLSIGKALPQRHNIVLSRRRRRVAPGCELLHSTEAALRRGDELNQEKMHEEREIIIMGGAKIYEQLIEKADRMYLTILEKDLGGDAFFPAYDAREWQETFSVREDYGGLFATFMQIERETSV